MSSPRNETTRLAFDLEGGSQTGWEQDRSSSIHSSIIPCANVKAYGMKSACGRFSRGELDALKDRMPELLAYYGITDVRRNFSCPSPDHEDSNPSASYDPKSKNIHCFGCDRTWDAFRLVGLIEGIAGFRDQVRRVAEIVGYNLSENTTAGTVKRVPASRAFGSSFPPPRQAGGSDCADGVFQAFNRLYEPEGAKALEYVHGRGFDDECIAHYGIGFASSPKDVIPWFGETNANPNGFVVIPFLDKGSTSAGYAVVRPVPGEWTGSKELKPKGAVSPIWQEWKLGAGFETVYVTEGVFDAISIEKLTGRHAVALLGTSGTNRLASVLEHTREGKRPKRVIVAMDRDEAGERAADRIAKDLDAIGIPHAPMPPYPGKAKDANEWLMSELEDASRGRGRDER